MTKFLRTSTKYYKRLGRKSKLKWRKPRGRHNKIRERRRGKLLRVDIGFGTSRQERKKKEAILIRNLKEAEKIEKGQLVIIAKLGKKKKKIVESKIKELGGKITNRFRK